MSKIPSSFVMPPLPSKFDDLEDVRKYFIQLNNSLFLFLQDFLNEFNGKVDTVNMLCSIVTVSDTGNANTDFAVQHNLGHKNIYYLPNFNTNPGSAVYIYKGSTAWTNDIAYLKCNLANQNITFLVWT